MILLFHLLAVIAVCMTLITGWVLARVICTARAYRKGYAAGFTNGLLSGRSEMDDVGADIIALIPYLDRQNPAPDA